MSPNLGIRRSVKEKGKNRVADNPFKFTYNIPTVSAYADIVKNYKVCGKMNELDLDMRIKKVLEKYKDVPFAHNGRTLQGLDCLGFIINFYKEFGIFIPNDDGKDIEEDWYKKEPQRYIRNIKMLDGVQVSFNDLRALDLVYFSVARNIITHTGIMINSSEFAHMSPKRNFQISKMERQWRLRSRGAIRPIK